MGVFTLSGPFAALAWQMHELPESVAPVRAQTRETWDTFAQKSISLLQNLEVASLVQTPVPSPRRSGRHPFSHPLFGDNYESAHSLMLRNLYLLPPALAFKIRRVAFSDINAQDVDQALDRLYISRAGHSDFTKTAAVLRFLETQGVAPEIAEKIRIGCLTICPFVMTPGDVDYLAQAWTTAQAYGSARADQYLSLLNRTAVSHQDPEIQKHAQSALHAVFQLSYGASLCSRQSYRRMPVSEILGQIEEAGVERNNTKAIELCLAALCANPQEITLKALIGAPSSFVRGCAVLILSDLWAEEGNKVLPLLWDVQKPLIEKAGTGHPQEIEEAVQELRAWTDRNIVSAYVLLQSWAEDETHDVRRRLAQKAIYEFKNGR